MFNKNMFHGLDYHVISNFFSKSKIDLLESYPKFGDLYGRGLITYPRPDTSIPTMEDYESAAKYLNIDILKDLNQPRSKNIYSHYTIMPKNFNEDSNPNNLEYKNPLEELLYKFVWFHNLKEVKRFNGLEDLEEDFFLTLLDKEILKSQQFIIDLKKSREEKDYTMTYNGYTFDARELGGWIYNERKCNENGWWVQVSGIKNDGLFTSISPTGPNGINTLAQEIIKD